MRGTLDRTVLVGAGLFAALLVTIAALTYRNTSQLNEDASWVAHTNEVLDLTGEVLLAIVDAETGQRGFLLTGRDEYLEPYNSALKRLEGLLATLKEETRDNPRQQDRIARLAGMTATRLTGLEQAIELRRKSEQEAQAFILTGLAKKQMDAIRELVGAMRKDEHDLLRDRQRRSSLAYQTAVTSGLLPALVGLGLVAAFIWLLHRSLLARQQAAAVLHEQREWFRTTLAGIGDAVIATDTEGRVRFLNSVAQKLTAWKEHEAEGQPLESVFKIVNEQTRKSVANPALRALKEGVVVGLANHTMLIARDGTERPIDDSAAPIRDADGKTIGAVLVFRDITARKKAEEGLAEQVRLMAMSAEVGAALTQGDTLGNALKRCAGALVEYLDGAFARIWTLDTEAGVLELQASAGLYTHVDGPHGGVPVGKLEIGLIAQERRAHLTNDVAGDPRVPDQEWAKREGLVAFAGYPLTVEDRLVGVMAMFARHALTPHTLDAMAAVADQIALGIERKRAEQEVARLLGLEQERSERLRQVAAASLTINSATTPTSVVDVIRAEAKRIIGTTHSDVSLQSEEQVLAGALRAALIGRGGRLLGHISLDGKTKGDFTQDDKAILTQLAHMAAVAYDNARLYEELRESDRRKDEFLATLAHELRNPLAPIRNSIHVMRLAGQDRATIDGSRAMIERQVQQMVRLVDDLLDLSRISRGQIELRTERVELATILTSAVETSRPLIEQSGHELTIALPQEPIPLVADPTRMAQVFSNLLNNAAKYTERGGHIWLSAQRDDGCVTVRVRDSGVGIPTEMLPRIFEMFTQVDRSLERVQGGLGIGLTLVKRLVEMHGGSIEAHSEGPKRGSEFVVRLPVALDLKATQSAAAGGEHAALRSNRRILVVDDNRDSADSLATMLNILGNEVRTAHDGLEAVDLAATFNPEVVLMDIGLPMLNGFDAARRMRDQPGGNDMVIVALTGWGQEEDRRRSQEAGFDHHIVKPVDPFALEKLLDGLETTTSRTLLEHRSSAAN
ncbi:MAG TPA: CHASE3 domain-containing protein [Isosphaeraceae bacterium]|nr:CHASE3 domain-containing protein [Isosphaeraceae bacterium]